MPKYITAIFCTSFLLFVGACEQDMNSAQEEITEEAIKVQTSLPMTEISLKDLSAFETKGENWKVAGDIYIDYENDQSFEVTEGNGILVNEMINGENAGLASKFEHGDLEMSLEFMLPKGSNSGIFLQGRYEIQLFDSYGIENMSSSDLGSIYSRWDDSKPEGQKAYDGHPATTNASKAPGLWQQMKFYFRAPRFNKEGIKVKNAQIEHLYLNGVKIQDNIDLSGPTRGGNETEVEYAPLLIQGDHGNIAIRNIKYKAYTQDSLTLDSITYKYFEHTQGIQFPNFDTVKILKEGSANFLDVNIANEKRNHYGLIFKGNLDVPKSGNYLFKTGIDDGGDLLIDKKIVVHNEESKGYNEVYGEIELEKGRHDFELRYYDDVWRATLEIEYEGPSIYVHKLGNNPAPEKPKEPEDPIVIDDVQETELLRSFSMYKGKKRTHVISVASPSSLHYTYDLSEASLLNFWRGGFGDLTGMWKSRGVPQTIIPLNASLEAVDGLPVKGQKKEDLVFEGYNLNENGEPIFSFTLNGLKWTDHISPSDDKKRLVRKIEINKKTTFRIAKDPNIKKLPNGLYSIDSQYYLAAENAEIKGDELLLSSNGQGTLSYNILW